VVALLLIYESKGLLVGEGMNSQALQKLRALAQSQPGVTGLGRMLTMHFGPHTVLLTMELDFRKGISAAETEAIVDRVKERIRAEDSDIKHIFIEVESSQAGKSSGGKTAQTA
jgi:divalent metal cation (Fe/Co/Zn/Cd) transporter